MTANHKHLVNGDVLLCAEWECYPGLNKTYYPPELIGPKIAMDYSPMTTRKAERIKFLEDYRATVLAHAKARIEDNDLHGGCDDLNDMREIDAELRGLRF